jgi:hypothetical protein
MARVIARALPGADEVYKLPEQRTDTALLTTARAFIREGQAAKERFVPLGMSENCLTDLQEQAIGGRRAGRSHTRRARPTGPCPCSFRIDPDRGRPRAVGLAPPGTTTLPNFQERGFCLQDKSFDIGPMLPEKVSYVIRRAASRTQIT